VRTSGSDLYRLLKKAHLLRCTQSPRYDVAPKYASARRFLVRLASETFLNSLESEFFNTLFTFVAESLYLVLSSDHKRQQRAF
jgi:hypothetical protein